MTGLIVKASYKEIGSSDVIGGICGSFFFVKNNIAVTAQHVLNKETFKPNVGYTFCKVWLLCEPNIFIKLNVDQIEEYKDIDTTIVRLKNGLLIAPRKIAKNATPIGSGCISEGFAGNPSISFGWVLGELAVQTVDFNAMRNNVFGTIQGNNALTVNANDIKIDNIAGYETSTGGRRGMSGGTLVHSLTQEVIGMLSFGLPQDVEIKTTLFAISIDNIIEKI